MKLLCLRKSSPDQPASRLFEKLAELRGYGNSPRSRIAVAMYTEPLPVKCP